MSNYEIYALPWFKEYNVFGIPKTLQPYPERPVFDILTQAARKFKKNGIIQFNYKLTYPQVKDHAERLATALWRMGLKKDDRVATLLPTSIQFVISDYAISRAGMIQIPCSSLEPVKNLEHKFKQGSPKALICTDTNLDIARQLAEKCGVDHLIVTKLEDYSHNPPAVRERSDLPDV